MKVGPEMYKSEGRAINLSLQNALNCLWIKLKFILLPFDLFLPSDFCVKWGTELVMCWQIPLRYFEILELMFVYTQESVFSRTMYIVKARGRNRLNFKFCNVRMNTYLNKWFPFIKLLMKVFGTCALDWISVFTILSLRISCTPPLPGLSWNWIMIVWRLLKNFWIVLKINPFGKTC